MKNPFKGLADKIKARLDKMKMTKERKAEFRKNTVDSFGDGCFVGGLTLLGAALFAPVATAPTLAAAAIFLAAGAGAKYTAGRMKPNGPSLEKAFPVAQPPAAEKAAGPDFGPKPAGPGFAQVSKPPAQDNKAAPSTPAVRPNPPPPVA